MLYIRKIVLILGLFLPLLATFGQETPFYPVSYRIFTPFVYNPAVAGSKDFTSVDLNASLQNNSYSQILSTNTRLWSAGPGYSLSPKLRQYSNIGIGGALFNDQIGQNRNMGGSIAGAYHFPVNKKELSFLSAGIAVKGIYSHVPGDELFELPEENLLSFNADAGIYYYDPNFYIGFSITNILGNPHKNDSLSLYPYAIDRQYFFHTGYKFVLSRALDIVLEPSLIIYSGDTISTDINEITDMIKPGLKLYMGKFCVGTYFYDFDKIPFFFQYKYPKFYVGTFFQIPRNIPFYKKELTAEIGIGINLGNNRFANKRNSHW